MEWTLMKRWVTGDKAEMEQEDIDRELFELAREWMGVSKLRKIPGHVAKEADVALCKQFHEHPKQKGAILVRFFRCPLRHRCGFLAGIRNMEGADLTKLDRCCEHNATSAKWGFHFLHFLHLWCTFSGSPPTVPGTSLQIVQVGSCFFIALPDVWRYK